METVLPKVFINALAIGPLRVILVMLSVSLGLITTGIVTRHNEPEITELNLLFSSEDYIEPESVSMPWWIVIAIPLIGFLFLKSFLFIRDDHEISSLVQIYLATILIFLPFTDQNVWFVGLITLPLFILSFASIRKKIFSRDTPEEKVEGIYQEWLVQHLSMDENTRTQIPQDPSKSTLQEMLQQEGWQETANAWYHSKRYTLYQNNAKTLVLTELSQTIFEICCQQPAVRNEIVELYQTQ